MQQAPGKIYQFSAIYDRLFGRNYAAESDFLEACLHRHGSVGERSFLELGCGPARNARELGKRGYRTVGLDLEPNMLAYALAEAQREGVSVELVQGNLIEFDLAQPVAMAACLWDTISLVLSNEEMVRHLRAVARNLRPGGIYLIETTHPRNFLLPYSGSAYQFQAGDTDIEVTWGLPSDPYDSLEQRYLATIRLIARHQGEIVEYNETRLPQRYYHFQELRALIEMSGAFANVHYYGRSSLPLLPLSDSPECDGMLAVLVRK